MKSAIFTGMTIIILGIIILLGVSMHGHFMPPETGILIICAGILWVIYSIVSRKKLDTSIKRLKKKEESFEICFKCRKPLYAASTNDDKCPYCGGNLEDLDGFYERHPELKEKG